MTELKPGWLQRQMDETHERCKLWPKDLLAVFRTICDTKKRPPNADKASTEDKQE